MINNALLQMAARGGRSAVPDAFARGAQQGNALRQFQQEQEKQNALAQIAQAYGQGGPETAAQTASQLGQLAPAMQLQQQQNRAAQLAQAQAFREQQFGAQQAQRDEDQAFRQQQFGAQQDFRGQQLDLQRQGLTQRGELARRKREEKAAAKRRGGKPTVDSAKAAGFFDRMQAAEKVLSDADSISAAMDRTNIAREGVASLTPFRIGGENIPEDFQKFDQARRDFVNAVLRRESGAVISDTEFANAAQQYFPVPGNSPEVIAQKAQNRRIAIEGIRRAGLPSLGEQPTERKQKRLKFNPETGALE